MGDLINKIMMHQRAYQAIGEPVPPYKCDLYEWNELFEDWKKKELIFPHACLLNIKLLYGIEIELCVKIDIPSKVHISEDGICSVEYKNG